ncbi:MAG: type II secretion system F family protein [Candidatus Nealsonbacteria bacterium]|nr:type II secretion system F family protein [Candidatus Nealsonbacteria bacterium]
MNVPLVVMVLLSFVAATAVVLALSLLVRDLKRPDEKLRRRLGLDVDGLDDSPIVLRTEQPAGRIDRFFLALVEGSGSTLSVSTAVSLVAGMAVVGCAAPLVLLENLLAAAGGLLLGAVLPLAWFAFFRARRLRMMKRRLPETLELLADGVRSGQTLEQAAQMVAEQAPAPLGEEFGYCVAQLKLGHSPTAVLARMNRRIPLPEFRIFATAVLVHRQTGGNLSLLAQRLAASARDRQESHGHVKAATAANRFSVIGLTIGTMVAVGILAWLQPEYLEIFRTHELGPSLLIAAGVLQTVGILWIWRVMKMQY